MSPKVPKALDVVEDEPCQGDDHEHDEGDGDEEDGGPLLHVKISAGGAAAGGRRRQDVAEVPLPKRVSIFVLK